MNNLESYPPILRHLSCDNHHQSPNLKDLYNSDTGSMNSAQDPLSSDTVDLVPTIDLESIDINKEKLEDACKDWGLFRLINHGVPLTLMKELHDKAKELFSLPYESKHASCNGDSPVTYFWGTPALTPTGTALTRGPKNINWVEGFDVPLARISQFKPQLPSLDSMRLLLMDYEAHLSRIATSLFKAMMKDIDLKSSNNNNLLKPPSPASSSLESYSNYLSEKTGIVRVYRYPHNCSCSNNYNNVGNWGMEIHTDSSVLSILNQDDEVSGLQVLKDDKWLDVKPIPNTLIVNLGDMMQAISNNRYKSVSHRVKVNKDKERISICYFVFPNEDYVIESSQYKPFTYNEFRAQVQQDVKTLGYKVGLSRFKKQEYNEDDS